MCCFQTPDVHGEENHGDNQRKLKFADSLIPEVPDKFNALMKKPGFILEYSHKYLMIELSCRSSHYIISSKCHLSGASNSAKRFLNCSVVVFN